MVQIGIESKSVQLSFNLKTPTHRYFGHKMTKSVHVSKVVYANQSNRPSFKFEHI